MSATGAKSTLKVVMGAMTFGEAGKEGTRVTTLEGIKAVLDAFQAHGHNEVDTAQAYGRGTSEQYLGKVDWKDRGLLMDTKLFPTAQFATIPGIQLISHSREDLRKWLDVQLKALQTESIDMWYLHAPDHTTPFEETLKAVDELHKEGKFKRFGVSNFTSWEVAEVVGICKANGYIQPSVYQGIYNAIQRKVEPELFPCLRKFGISFYAFAPLAGGFFTGRYRSMQDSIEPGSRFDAETNKLSGTHHRARYWNEQHFAALAKVESVAEKHGLTLAEVALRWLSHHSLLKRELGDAVIIGASSVKHVEQNLVDLEKGPLPEDVVKALDEAWGIVAPIAFPYFH